jgi:ubiquinone/menaquinone biosynthesis C-methylase UbiE
MAKDLFSTQAKTYAQYRPSYPQPLYDTLLADTTGRDAAWDCATGNGQAAIVLAEHFATIEATDISEAQLANAPAKPNIHYSIAPAEATSFADNSFDLITVAQAYHWLDWKAFRREATRVGKQNAVVAIWTYNRFTTPDKKLNDLFDHFYQEVTGPYWEAERRHVDSAYETVDFHFKDVQTREFATDLRWNKEAVLGYLSSWSAVQKYIRQEGASPLLHIQDELDALWPDETLYSIHFPIYLKWGRIIK